ncbi:MAG: phage baseplate assembly protein V [Desulfobacterium sp.]|nr:phage baseplate assembly protein V [Desulfobacterium sp.]
MIQDIANRLTRMEERFNHFVRVGVVVSTKPETGTVRVQFMDADGMVSHDLPALVPKTMEDKHYHMPDVGEQVLAIFLPLGLEQGFVLGSFYSNSDQVPVQDQNLHHVRFKDGTTVDYDRARHLLKINCVGRVVVNSAVSVKVTAPNIELN